MPASRFMEISLQGRLGRYDVLYATPSAKYVR